MARCPACGSTRLAPAFRGSDLTFLRCRGCRSLIDAEPPAPGETMAIYEGRDYYVKDAHTPEERAALGYAKDYLADRPFIEAKFDQVLAHVERAVAPGRLLDVGAGPGFMVATAARRGWDAVGIDVNEWAATHARVELGVDVRVGRLDRNAFAGEQFDAITMMDLIEHVPDPDEILAEAARLTRPGGVVAILTPDAGALVSRTLGRRWPEVGLRGEHVVLFSLEGLTAALARHGFTSTGWHSVGKTASISTLVADVAPAAPAIVGRLQARIEGRPVAQRVIELDPRTKLCLYARREPTAGGAPSHRPPRVAKRPKASRSTG